MRSLGNSASLAHVALPRPPVAARCAYRWHKRDQAAAATKPGDPSDPSQKRQRQQQQQQQECGSRQDQQGSQPRLTWRRPAQQQHTTPAAAAESDSQPGPGEPDTAARQLRGLSNDIAAAAAAATAEQQYVPALPAPGFFRPQVAAASQQDCADFLAAGINKLGATPCTAAEADAAAAQLLQQQSEARAQLRQQLPPELAARLAPANAAGAAALAAARARPGGLSEEQQQVAEAMLGVADATQSVCIAELAVSVVEDLAAGQTPDDDTLELLLDPLLGVMEASGATGPQLDQVLMNLADDRPIVDDPAAALAADLTACLSEFEQWESLARMIHASRDSICQLSHLLLVLRRLPGLTPTAQMGIKEQLRWQHFVTSVLDDVASFAAEEGLSPAAAAAVAVALGRLTPEDTSSVVPVLQQQVSENLAAFSVRQLADILWGLGKAAPSQVPEQWVQALWEASLAKSRPVLLDTVSIAKALFAFTLLGFRPGRQQLQPFYSSCISHFPSFSPLQLSNTLWAVAELGLQPPSAWLAALLAAFSAEQPDATPLGGSSPTAATLPASPEHQQQRQQQQEEGPSPAAAVPANVAALASSLRPYIFQHQEDGPAPSSPHSLDYYWGLMLQRSNFGEGMPQQQQQQQQIPHLPRLLGQAPGSLLSLSPEQLQGLVVSLSQLQAAAGDEVAAELLDQLWAAAIGFVASGWQEAAAGIEAGGEAPTGIPVVGELRVAQLRRADRQQQQQQQKQQQPSQKQQRGSSGFGKQKQQQQAPGAAVSAWSRDWVVKPQLLEAFDAATGGLWQAAAAGDWTLGQLAAATAAMDASTSPPAPAAVAPGLSAQRTSFMTAWYAASEVLLPHTEPSQLVTTLRAVAQLSSRSWWSRGLSSTSSSSSGQAGATATATPALPLPPGSWLAAAVGRLSVVRSALSELALFHALEALAELLACHPERQQLLAPPQQQQASGQWWWRRDRQAWLEQQAAFAAHGDSPAVAVIEGGRVVLQDAPGEEQLQQEGWEDGEQLSLAAAAALAATAAARQRIPDTSWVYGSSLAGVPTSLGTDTDSDTDSSSSGGGSLASGCRSLWNDLRGLTECLGSELGNLLQPELAVAALRAVVRISPALVDAAWLCQLEASLLQQLQQHLDPTTSSNSGQSSGRSSSSGRGDRAAAAGITPNVARSLLATYASCGHQMRQAALRQLCEQLAA